MYRIFHSEINLFFEKLSKGAFGSHELNGIQCNWNLNSNSLGVWFIEFVGIGISIPILCVWLTKELELEFGMNSFKFLYLREFKILPILEGIQFNLL